MAQVIKLVEMKKSINTLKLKEQSETGLEAKVVLRKLQLM
jgi:hypothetical protein